MSELEFRFSGQTQENWSPTLASLLGVLMSVALALFVGSRPESASSWGTRQHWIWALWSLTFMWQAIEGWYNYTKVLRHIVVTDGWRIAMFVTQQLFLCGFPFLFLVRNVIPSNSVPWYVSPVVFYGFTLGGAYIFEFVVAHWLGQKAHDESVRQRERTLAGTSGTVVSVLPESGIAALEFFAQFEKILSWSRLIAGITIPFVAVVVHLNLWTITLESGLNAWIGNTHVNRRLLAAIVIFGTFCFLRLVDHFTRSKLMRQFAAAQNAG
jgi:hypothetical protein